MCQQRVSKRCQSIDEILAEKYLSAEKFNAQKEFEILLDRYQINNSYVYKILDLFFNGGENLSDRSYESSFSDDNDNDISKYK